MVHADFAQNNYIEEGTRIENMKDELENVNAGGLTATSVHSAANPVGLQPELLGKGKDVYGHKSGQPLPEDAVRGARGREIGLMTDHGMYDARGAARGKLVRAKWLDDWRKNGMRSRPVARRTRHLWSLHVFLSARRHRLGRRLVQWSDVWQDGIAVSLSTTRRAPWDSCGSFDSP